MTANQHIPEMTEFVTIPKKEPLFKYLCSINIPEVYIPKNDRICYNICAPKMAANQHLKNDS